MPFTTTGRARDAAEADDAALAARGEGDGFIRLYRRYLPAVFRYVFVRVGNRQDAEDVTAQVFERAWAGIGRYRDTGSFSGWLFTIAHRAVVDHFRQRRPPAVPLDTLAEALHDTAAGPEERGLITEEVLHLLTMLAALGPDQQQVIALRFMADLPYAEIGRIMGKREAAVKMLAYRALEDIRRRCGDGRA
jgi:RNA polymerase sigma-70 factor (ECF subfamily)